MTTDNSTEKDWLVKERAFITAVTRQLADDTKVRPALRKGLKRLPAEAPSMFQYLVPHSLAQSGARENACYAVAAMIAAGTDKVAESNAPRPANLGAILAQAVATGAVSETAAESRLNLLVRQDQYGLIRYLPSTIRQTRELWDSATWAQLLADLSWWDSATKATRKRWLQAFWRERNRSPIEQAKHSESDDEPEQGD